MQCLTRILSAAVIDPPWAAGQGRIHRGFSMVVCRVLSPPAGHGSAEIGGDVDRFRFAPHCARLDHRAGDRVISRRQERGKTMLSTLICTHPAIYCSVFSSTNVPRICQCRHWLCRKIEGGRPKRSSVPIHPSPPEQIWPRQVGTSAAKRRRGMPP